MQRVQVPQQVLLSWFSGSSFQATASVADIATPDVRPGQRWRLTARLQPPFALMNPGAFDHELWMFEQNLRAQGTVVRQSPLLLTQTLWHPFEQWRWHVRRAIDQQINDAQAAGVLSGLAFGDQGAIQSEDWDVFRKTGVAHLLAVSGLHITLFSWVASAAMRRTWRWWPVHWQVAIDRTTAGRWGGVALAFGYALFTGWGLPAQRTVLMLSWVACLRQRAWQWPWPMILAGSAVVVTVVDPWALLQAGFWLSFAAVGLLMLGGDSAAKGWRAACWQSLETQARATVGLAPLSVVFFHQVPLLGLAANLVAIPWVTFVITPLALGGMVLPSLWSMGTWTVKALMAFLTPLANSASAVWQVQAASSGWVLLLGLSAAVLGLAPLPWSLRCLAVPLALPMFFPGAVRPESGAFEVIAADVGQGTAVLIRTASHTLLFDSGPRYSAHSDAGGRVIAPLLHLLGEERLDTLVLSHSDLDHIGGAKAVAQALPVTRLLSSLKPTHELHRLFKVSEPCLPGQRWTWDGVTFEVLHPTPRDLQRHRAGHTKPNTVSCVVRVQNSAQHSVLLTGDIEAAQEWDLVNSLGSRLQTEVLIVPHHGSKTSSTPAFLDAVQPRWAVFQAGWRNRYGHPAPLVMQRYVDRSIGVVTSPTCGAWRWMASAQTASAGFKPQDYVCERSLQDRYWRTKIGGMF
jgi:competence protein ComEC